MSSLFSSLYWFPLAKIRYSSIFGCGGSNLNLSKISYPKKRDMLSYPKWEWL